MAETRVVVAHWPEIEKHLNTLLEQAHVFIERAESDREIWEARGRAKQLRELLVLPETLTVLRS